MEGSYYINGRRIELDMLVGMYKLGATDGELAAIFGLQSAQAYKKLVESDAILRECMLAGSLVADSAVSNALYRRATGYKGVTTKVLNTAEGVRVVRYDQYMPPDVDACRIWLRQRRPEQWSDKAADKPNTDAKDHNADRTRAELFDKFFAAVEPSADGELFEQPVAGSA